MDLSGKMGVLFLLVVLHFVRGNEAKIPKRKYTKCARYCGNPCAAMKCAVNTECVVDTCGDCSASCQPKSCDRVCFANYAPVCATDGKTYSNRCMLGVAMCKDSTIKFKHSGACKKMCSGICTADWAPVCGTDGKTYSNKCSLDYANCKDQSITLRHEGKCKCSPMCTREYFPICGTDGKTYGNMCMFKYAKCKDESISLQHRGQCKRKCSPKCTREYDPVCGSNGKMKKTYSNQCMFNYAKCKNKNLKKLHKGVCKKKFRLLRKKEKCSGKCPMIYRPVCGSDGKNYGNKCLFGYAQCKNKFLKLKNEGPCDGDGDM